MFLLSCFFPCKTMGFVKTYRRGSSFTFPGNLMGLDRLKAQEIDISPCLTFFIQEKLFLSLFTRTHCSCSLVFFLVTGFLLITGFYGPFRTSWKGNKFNPDYIGFRVKSIPAPLWFDFHMDFVVTFLSKSYHLKIKRINKKIIKNINCF